MGVTAPLDNSLLVTRKETSDSVELGVKGSGLDRRIQFTGDVFYQHFDGYIGRTVDLINASSQRNGVIDGTLNLNFNGDATSVGVEGQLDAVVTPGGTVGLKASFVDAHYDNALEPCNRFDAGGAAIVPIGQQVNFCPTSTRIAETPRFHLTVSSEYAFDLGSYEPYISGLFTYQPGFHSDVVNYDYDDLPLLNFYAGVRDERQGWDVSAFVKNLFDFQRVTSISEANYQQATSILTPAFSVAPGQPLDSGYRTVNVSVPREFGVTVRYSF